MGISVILSDQETSDEEKTSDEETSDEETSEDETSDEETSDEEKGLSFGQEENDKINSSQKDNQKDKIEKNERECKFKSPCINDLQEALVDSTKENPIFYTILSGITAAVGLATDSPATIIGSMLLSPVGDVIVRMALILNFKYNLEPTMEDRNLSKEAFQKRFLKRLNIKYKKLHFDNSEKNLKLYLRSKDKNEPIKEIYKYHDNVYFKFENTKLFDINGNEKFTIGTNFITPINSSNKILETVTDDKTSYKNYFKITMTNLIKKLNEFEKQEWINIRNVRKSFGDKYSIGIIVCIFFVVCLFAIFIGFICGICFYQANKKGVSSFVLPTKEMKERAKMENAWGMIFIATVAGFILPHAIRRKGAIRLVGINIATALLPPLVNIGLYLGLKVMKEQRGEMTKDEEEHITEAWMTGIVIFFINFIILLAITFFSLNFICKSQEGEKDDGIFKDFDLC